MNELHRQEISSTGEYELLSIRRMRVFQVPHHEHRRDRRVKGRVPPWHWTCKGQDSSLALDEEGQEDWFNTWLS